MGLFSIFRRTKPTSLKSSASEEDKKTVVGAIATDAKDVLQSYDNNTITFSGELSSYDYDSILRDKQANINSLYQLADYYVDKDPVVRGIIKHVYVPYATCSKWYLSGDNEKTIALFEEQYKKMRLREKLDDIMFQYFKYGNVFVYIWDGNLITLPVHKCKIGNTMLNGTPIVDFDVQSVQTEFRQKTYSIKEQKVKDSLFETILKGYPQEVRQAIKQGQQYAQLNPDNTFVLQGTKEGWQRYAVPFIASCLYPLAKKELISSYENSLLNLGIRSFVHVTYGESSKEKGFDMLPDKDQLTQVQRIFSTAMAGYPLAVTNHLAKANVVQPDMADLFQWDKYRHVNNDILSAGGISGVIVNGETQQGSSFASAQVSMQAAAARIEAARQEFCDLMQKVNARLVEDMKITHTNNLKDIPEFRFKPLDLTGEKSLRDTCTSLWQQGLVSTKTMLDTHGYSLAREKTQRETEITDGTNEVMVEHSGNTSSPSADGNKGDTKDDGTAKVGRPTEDNSDEDASERGKQPKPSNPEGSTDS